MAQYENIDQLSAGTKYGAQRTSVTESYEAESELGFGKAGFGYLGDPDTVTDVFNDQNTMDYSVDFIADNVIAFTVNGEAIDPVTFDTDHATTMGLLAAAIEALNPDYKTEVSGNDIIVTTPGEDIVITSSVTGGASQPTATPGTAAPSADLVYLGPVVKAQKAPTEITNSELAYVKGETVEVMRSGYLVGVVDDIANCQEHAPVYVITTGADKGKFTGTVGSNLLIDATFHFLADKSKDLAVINFQNALPKVVA